MQRPVFNPEINYGHIFLIFGWLVSAAGGISWVSSSYSELKQEIAVIEAKQTKYIPVLEANSNTQLILQQRTDANADTIRLLREQLQDLQRISSATDKNVATLVAQSEFIQQYVMDMKNKQQKAP